MANAARQGDLNSHGGYNVSGSPDTITNGYQQMRLGDMVYCPKHGMVYIITGSPSVIANGYNVARMGDLCSCGAYLTTASPDTFAS